MKNQTVLKSKYFFTMTIATSMLLLTSACTKEKIIEKEKFIEKLSVTDQSDAESMALAAEQLLGSWNFPFGLKLLDLALTKDPSNQRALFYKHLTMPAVKTFKGYFSRMKPIANKTGKLIELNKMADSIKKNYPAMVSDFLLNGAEDIFDAKDYQNYVVEIIKSLGEFRQFLKNNPDLNLTLYANTDFTFNGFYSGKGYQNYIENYCQFKKIGENSGWNIECDLSKANQFILSPADALVIRQGIAGYYLYGILMTSYSINGLESLTPYSDKNLTPSEIQALLFNLPEFGKLRPDNHLKDVQNLGSDLLAAFKYVADNQNTYCPKIEKDPSLPPWIDQTNKKRKGYVLEYGVCITPSQTFETDLALIEKAVVGNVDVTINTVSGQTVNTTVNPLEFARNPIMDLRSIAPTSYNNCNQPISLADKTLTGVFPKGDAEILLKDNCKNH